MQPITSHVFTIYTASSLFSLPRVGQRLEGVTCAGPGQKPEMDTGHKEDVRNESSAVPIISRQL